MRIARLRLLLILLLLVPCLAQSHPPRPEPLAAHPRLSGQYGQLPMTFEANQAQSDPRVRFLARGSGYELFLTPDEAVLELAAGRALNSRLAGSEEIPESGATSVLRMKLIGANVEPTLSGVAEL